MFGKGQFYRKSDRACFFVKKLFTRVVKAKINILNQPSLYFGAYPCMGLDWFPLLVMLSKRLLMRGSCTLSSAVLKW